MTSSLEAAPDETVQVADLAAFQKQVRRWLAAHLARRVDVPAREREGGQGSPARARAVQAMIHDAGYAGLSWPCAYGGRGLSMEHQRVFNEEAAEFVISTDALVVGLGMCAPALLEFGSEEQKRRHIATMLRGDEIWCQLFSEPDAGSDIASLRTSARRDGDEWVVNGQKVWTSGAHFADYGLLIARTDPSVPKHRGISMFIVDMRAPGVTIRPLRQMTGTAEFNEVFLDDLRLPADSLVGVENEGWRAVIGTLMNERVSIGAGGGGLGRRVGGNEFAHVVAVARAAGRLDDPVARSRIATVYCDSRALELLSDRIRAQVKAGRTPDAQGSIAKIAGTELVRTVAEVAAELAGARAAAWTESDEDAWALARAVLGAPGNSIAGGTTDILKTVIGERVLGLPKEPRVDPDRPSREL